MAANSKQTSWQNYSFSFSLTSMIWSVKTVTWRPRSGPSKGPRAAETLRPSLTFSQSLDWWEDLVLNSEHIFNGKSVIEASHGTCLRTVRERKKKGPVPCGIWTHDLLIERCLLYRCATISAQSSLNFALQGCWGFQRERLFDLIFHSLLLQSGLLACDWDFDVAPFVVTGIITLSHYFLFSWCETASSTARGFL